MAKRKVKKTTWKAEIPAITKANEHLIATEVTIPPIVQGLFNTIMHGIQTGEIQRIKKDSNIHPDQRIYANAGLVDFFIKIPHLQKISKIESNETFYEAFESVRKTVIRFNIVETNNNEVKRVGHGSMAVLDPFSVRWDILCFGFGNFFKDIIEKLGGNDYNILIYNKEEDEID